MDDNERLCAMCTEIPLNGRTVFFLVKLGPFK